MSWQLLVQETESKNAKFCHRSTKPEIPNCFALGTGAPMGI